MMSALRCSTPIGDHNRALNDTNNLTDFAVESVQTYDDEMRSFKRKLIMRSLELTGNNKVQAAKALGISRSSLHRIIDELKLAS